MIAATIAAGTLGLLGLQWVAGRPGVALGAVTLLLVGNPLSGASTAPEFLATPWREIGQAMPPGAGSQLLRSVSFFDGAGSLTPSGGAGSLGRGRAAPPRAARQATRSSTHSGVSRGSARCGLATHPAATADPAASARGQSQPRLCP